MSSSPTLPPQTRTHAPPPPPPPPPTHTDNEYDATVKLPSTEFQRIVKDLSTIGDTGERC